MLKIMFLCTGNMCRSQMAEGLAREYGKGVIVPFSAGVNPSGIVHPRAVSVMKELGIDISSQKSKAVDIELLNTMDIIITLCGNAEASCPMTPPQIKRMHWAINDPVGAVGSEEEIMSEFRKARDDIKERMLSLIETLRSQVKP